LRAMTFVVLSAGLACASPRTETRRSNAPVSLSQEPLLTIGGARGHPLYEVIGATIVDGQIVVANAGSREIQVYDTTGNLVRAFGHQGKGPGEFVDITWLQEVNGQLFVYDRQLDRISEFDLDGRLIHTANAAVPRGYTYVRALGVLTDGSVLVFAQPERHTPRTMPSRYRDTLDLLRLAPDGTYRDSIGAAVWTERYVERWGRGGQIFLDVPFGRRSAIAVRGPHYYLMEDDDPRIDVYDTTGTLLRSLGENVGYSAQSASDAQVKWIRRRILAAFPPGVDVGGITDRVPIASTLPPYGWEGKRQLTLLRVDAMNMVWVLETGGIEDEPPVWTVLAPDGSLKARVTADEELDVLYSNATMALVHRWNTLDVERLELRVIDW
jgi:hypothetical protein